MTPVVMRIAASLPAAALILASAAAHAHIRLDFPKGRYNNDPQQAIKQKDGPCGVVNDSRTTDASLITKFAPGETITVEWTETINHSGHFRIAFVEKGQDFPEPTFEPAEKGGAILADGIADEKAMNGAKHSFEVTLPNVTCDACTLQLIQVMKESPNDPYYFQCADIVLEGDVSSGGTGGAAGGANGGAAGETNGGAAGMLGNGGAAGTAGSAGGGPLGGNSGNGGAASTGGAGDGGDGGSTMSTGGTAPQAGAGGAPSIGTGGSAGTPATPSSGGSADLPSQSTGGTAPASPGGLEGTNTTEGGGSPEPGGGCALSSGSKRSAGALMLAFGALATWLVRRRARCAERVQP